MKLTVDGRSYEVEVQPDAVVVEGTPYKVVTHREDGDTVVKVGGRPYKVKAKDDTAVLVDGREHLFALSGKAGARLPSKVAKGPAKVTEKGAVKALMPGKVLSVRVAEGEQVAAGAVLLILEAMKMENEIRAPHDGVVKRVAVSSAQVVNNGDVLVVIE